MQEERNFRIHLVAVGLVSWFSFLYEVAPWQAVVLVILFAAVLSLELMNTALEHTVDLCCGETVSPIAKRAKDAAAGGVLVFAVASVIAAVLMFRDPTGWALVLDKLSSPVHLAVLLLYVFVSLFFVFAPCRKK